MAYVYAGMLIHEMGHACVSKLFAPGVPTPIHLFADSSGQNGSKEILFSIFNIHVHKSFYEGGYCCTALPADLGQNYKLKEALIRIAGGAAFLLFAYVCFAGQAAKIKHQECGNLKKSIIFGFKNALTPYKNLFLNKKLSKVELIAKLAFISVQILHIVSQIFYAFLPSSSTNHADGTMFWRMICDRTPIPGKYVSSLADYCAILILLEKSISVFNKYFEHPEVDEQTQTDDPSLENQLESWFGKALSTR